MKAILFTIDNLKIYNCFYSIVWLQAWDRVCRNVQGYFPRFDLTIQREIWETLTFVKLDSAAKKCALKI